MLVSSSMPWLYCGAAKDQPLLFPLIRHVSSFSTTVALASVPLPRLVAVATVKCVESMIDVIAYWPL